MLDPATLAAVRERIAGMRKNDPDNGLWEHGWNAALNALAVALEVVTPLPAAPPLTEVDVRRIAREEIERTTAEKPDAFGLLHGRPAVAASGRPAVAKAMADRPEPNSPTMTPNSTQPNTWPAAVEPPAQPAAAKRGGA